jgi:hypothetical protein
MSKKSRILVAVCGTICAVSFIACVGEATPKTVRVSDTAPASETRSKTEHVSNTVPAPETGIAALQDRAAELYVIPNPNPERAPQVNALVEARLILRQAEWVALRVKRSKDIEDALAELAVAQADEREAVNAHADALKAAKIKAEADAKAEANRLVPQPDADPKLKPTNDEISQARGRRAAAERRLTREALAKVDPLYQLPSLPSKPEAPPVKETVQQKVEPGTSSPATGGRVYVRGYTRKDGTYVRPHTRSR